MHTSGTIYTNTCFVNHDKSGWRGFLIFNMDILEGWEVLKVMVFFIGGILKLLEFIQTFGILFSLLDGWLKL